MNTLALRWKIPRQGYARLQLLIDGSDFADTVHRYERRHVPRPDKSQLSIWSGFFEFSSDWLEYWLENSGSCDTWDFFDGYAVILVCGDCGVDGCDALTADIQVKPKTVQWSRFCNPRHPTWDYSGLGPFTFSRRTYTAEIERALTEMEARFGG